MQIDSGDSYTSAHEIKAMYLCPNKHTANGHYLYNWVTERVITRSSLKRVAGIPDGWNKSNVVVPEVIDEDGNIFDFINGPSSSRCNYSSNYCRRDS
jgi:hypothetical protein